jgi:hypothetical protein
MSLSCSCNFDYEFDAGDWQYFYEYNEMQVTLDAKRRQRCVSCGKLIDVGAICNVYHRYRYPWDDIEARIKCGCDDIEDSFNDEPTIKIAPHYHCERCGEIWMNLTDIGYECLSPNENMEEALKQYHELSGFKKEADNA